MTETELMPIKNVILGSIYEEEINNMKFQGFEYRQIEKTLWEKYRFKCSIATLSRYFVIKKKLGPLAVKDVKTHLKDTYKEEYMDLAGRVAFFNEVIQEAKRRFQLEKTNLDLMDLMNLATKMGDSLQRIEGADSQNDLIRQFATLILESKTEAVPIRLPIIDAMPDGSSVEISNEATTDEQEEPAEAQSYEPVSVPSE